MKKQGKQPTDPLGEVPLREQRAEHSLHWWMARAQLLQEKLLAISDLVSAWDDEHHGDGSCPFCTLKKHNRACPMSVNWRGAET